MTVRTTICALSLVAGAALSTTLGGCELERTQHPADTSPVENGEPAPQTEGESGEQAAASTGFGVHVGSYEREENLTAVIEPLPDKFYRTGYYNPEPFLTGDQGASFTETVDQDGNPALGFRLNDEGAELMRETTSARISQPMVLTFDGEVISAPVVQSTISRSGMVTGFDNDPWWLDDVRAEFIAAGALDRKEVFEPQLPPPPPPPEVAGIGVWVASTQQSDFFFGDFPLLEGTMLYANNEPLLIVDHFAGATPTTDEDSNPALRLELSEAGKTVMAERADLYVGNYLIPSWKGWPINAFEVTCVIDDAIIVSDAGIAPELADDWYDALDASLPE